MAEDIFRLFLAAMGGLAVGIYFRRLDQRNPEYDGIIHQNWLVGEKKNHRLQLRYSEGFFADTVDLTLDDAPLIRFKVGVFHLHGSRTVTIDGQDFELRWTWAQSGFKYAPGSIVLLDGGELVPPAE